MSRLNLLLAASLVAVTAVAHADTTVNLNATIPGETTSYGTPNNLAPTFFGTVTLGPGTYTVAPVSGLYSGWDNKGNGTSPAPGYFQETVGFSTGGDTFTQASSANNEQNSYTTSASDKNLFTGNYSSFASALAAAQPYTFTLASSTAVSFYIPDNSFLPTGDYTGFDDNTGGVSLNIKSAAVTPEPSSLVLLGTSALGFAGAVRRRLSR